MQITVKKSYFYLIETKYDRLRLSIREQLYSILKI